MLSITPPGGRRTGLLAITVLGVLILGLAPSSLLGAAQRAAASLVLAGAGG